ncbi:hypothetical protein AGABI2DRAFT_122770 [Agaricus bisporus var. bisporus H97]|uniref:hypothetical protein n=1 Tax=Agaricus bisporus var. bisporus (strain H97 / ATCC MYA-4626 / FGSC 10389) TaxID=936046 RepID=UPI00029F750D|nr:hypothetical protein AGABI2DRAFT_122770 [Agaricus bisporus var. bisporus H97]EKV42552.1 hypothetical protein AGABI2DRAFT_122770 [Agaricus bisporus var. bisporus H97]
MGRDPPHRRSSPQSPNSHSEQPLAEEDVVKMRARIADMGLSSDAEVQNLTSKEKELGGMVVKLLDSFIDPAQLLRQAEFITWLGSQRDLLVRSFEEERQRWEAERDGWNRMAEALLAQQAKTGISPSRKEEEVEHQHNMYESENKALREKASLQDYQLRFSALEFELNKLKPLLLMQPPISGSSADHLLDFKSLKARRKAVDTPSVREHANSEDSLTTNQPDDSTHNTPRSEYYRRQPPGRSSFFTPLQSRTSARQTPMRSVFSVSQTPSTQPGSPKKPKHKTKKSYHSNLPPLSADARTEHLLLAARKIGRERANVISGFMRHIEKERENIMQERDRERLDRDRTVAGVGHTFYRKDDLGTGSSSITSSTAPSMPKTPKRGSADGQSTTHFLTPTTLMTPRSDPYPPLNNAPSSFVFVGSPPVTSYQNSVFTPRPAGHMQASTPAAKTLRRTSATPATHPTPLASLLSAAKSMMDDESNEPHTHSNSRRRTGAVEPPDSPVPKRRRVSNGNTGSNRGKVDMLAAASTLGTDRVRSALDVLADQAAAAFDSDWQSPSKSPAKVATRSRGKDKGHTATCSPVPSEEDLHDDSTPKGRVRSAESPAPALGRTGSPVSTRSRSQALLVHRLSKGTSRSQQKKKDRSSVTPPPGALNAPRMIFSPLLRSPTLPLSPSPTAVTPPSIPAEDENDPVRVVVNKESRNQKSLLDDDSPTSSNGASDPPVLLNVGDDHPHVPGDPITIGPRNSSSRSLMVIDGEPKNKGETSESSNRLPELLTENHGDRINSVAVDNQGGEEIEGVKHVFVEGTQVTVTEGRETQGHNVQGGSSDDAYDTDADAEGEMDVEAEETVFMGSSSTIHVPVVSTYSLDASDVMNQPAEGRSSEESGLTEP